MYTCVVPKGLSQDELLCNPSKLCLHVHPCEETPELKRQTEMEDPFISGVKMTIHE